MQNVVCIINGMLRKMKTDEQNTPLNEMLICSICLTTDIQSSRSFPCTILNRVISHDSWDLILVPERTRQTRVLLDR